MTKVFSTPSPLLIPEKLEVKPEKVIAEIKSVFTRKFDPLLDLGPIDRAGVSRGWLLDRNFPDLSTNEGLRNGYEKLFDKILAEFEHELRHSPAAGSAIREGGAIHSYVYDQVRHFGAPVAKNVFIAINNFMGTVKAFPDADHRRQALESFLSLTPTDLVCGNGTVERLNDILAPMLPGNPLLTTTYTDSRNRHLIQKNVLARDESVHAVTTFDKQAGVSTAEPSGAGEAWSKGTLKHDVETAIHSYLETSLQNVFDGLDALFKDGKTPSKDEIQQLEDEHALELSCFLPIGARLHQPSDITGDFITLNEATYEYESFNREKIIASVAEKLFGVLTFDSQLKLFKYNPELFDIPKAAFNFIADEPNSFRTIAAEFPERMPALSALTDEATQDNVLHRFLQNGHSVAALIAHEAITADLIAQQNQDNQTPVDLMVAHKNLADLMVVALLCKTNDEAGNAVWPALTKYYDGGKPKASVFITIEGNNHFLDRCKEIGDLEKSAHLINLAFASPFSKEYVLSNFTKFAQWSSDELEALHKGLSLPADPSAPDSQTLDAYVRENLDNLPKLSAEQILLTAEALSKGKAKARFVRDHADVWFNASAEAMRAYGTLVETKIARGVPLLAKHRGAEFLKRHLDTFQKLDDRQKMATAHAFAQHPAFLQSNAKAWFKLDAAQMVWTSAAAARHLPVIEQRLRTSWFKMPAVKMAQFVQSIDAEPGSADLTLRKYDDVRKFNILQMQHTLNLLKLKGGRQFLDAHFKQWETFSYDEMKALFDVLKGGGDTVQPIDVNRWMNLPFSQKLFLGDLARRGESWNDLSARLLPLMDGQPTLNLAELKSTFEPLYFDDRSSQTRLSTQETD
jgi:hypothetical protein